MFSKNVPEAVAIASKGFVMGVALGLSGVVVKPIKGNCTDISNTNCAVRVKDVIYVYGIGTQYFTLGVHLN